MIKVNILQGRQKFNINKNSTSLIIDVLRAGTTAQFILEQNIKNYLLAKDKDHAFELKNYDSNVVLIGENKGIKIEKFDIGNSPIEIMDTNLENKTIVHLTTNGVKAINNNFSLNTYFCGFCNAESIIKYFRTKNYKEINIIASDPNSDDDMACAEYIKGKLNEENELSTESIVNRIKKSKAAQKFLNNNEKFPFEDLEIATKFRKTNFVIKIEQNQKQLMAKPIYTE